MSDNIMEMKLKLPPESIEDKPIRKSEIDRYVTNTSLENLVLQLRYLRRQGSLDYRIYLDEQYVASVKDRQTLALRSDVLQPVAPYNFLYVHDAYGLSALHTKAEDHEPLSDSDIVMIGQHMPVEAINSYLTFELTNIDWEALEEVVADNPHDMKSTEETGEVEFNGLAVSGGIVSYRGRTVALGYQHREVIRFLIGRKGGLCFADEFTDPLNGILVKEYANPEVTLRKLISAVRAELKILTGKDCIKNVPGEGWQLDL